MRIIIEADEYGDQMRGIYCLHNLSLDVESWNIGKEICQKAGNAAIEAAKIAFGDNLS